MRYLCLYLLAFWGAAEPCLAESNRVSWLLNERFRPAHIVEGPLAGAGFLDIQLQWLISHLGMFDNEIVEVSNSRGLYEMSLRDGQCMIGVAATPDRMKVALFSQVALVVPAAGLMIRTADLPLVAPFTNSGGAIDLDLLSESKKIRGVFARDRHFGRQIDRFINSGLTSLISVQDAIQAFKMVDSGRADYLFGYTFERQFYKKTINDGVDMAFLPIAGSVRAFPAHVACSKGPIGEAVIRQIDHLLDASPRPPPYMDDVSQWFDADEVPLVNDPVNWGHKPTE